jgi:hypothetical protein
MEHKMQIAVVWAMATAMSLITGAAWGAKCRDGSAKRDRDVGDMSG